MPNFRYQVLDDAGKSTSGVLDAATISDASRKLKAEGKYIVSLELDKGRISPVSRYHSCKILGHALSAVRDQEVKEMHW